MLVSEFNKCCLSELLSYFNLIEIYDRSCFVGLLINSVML